MRLLLNFPFTRSTTPHCLILISISPRGPHSRLWCGCLRFTFYHTHAAFVRYRLRFLWIFSFLSFPLIDTYVCYVYVRARFLPYRLLHLISTLHYTLRSRVTSCRSHCHVYVAVCRSRSPHVHVDYVPHTPLRFLRTFVTSALPFILPTPRSHVRLYARSPPRTFTAFRLRYTSYHHYTRYGFCSSLHTITVALPVTYVVLVLRCSRSFVPLLRLLLRTFYG